MPSFGDIFAGIGGFRLAFEAAEFECKFASEKNPACVETYQKNFGEKPAGNISLIAPEAIPDLDVFCGGFPCQSFSICGSQRGFEDTRGTLFFEICRLNAKDFGLPQNRERIFIVASKEKKFVFPQLAKKPERLSDWLDQNNEYLPKSNYTLIKEPKQQKSGLIFAGYKNGTLRKNGVRPGTDHLSRSHRQPNRIYSNQGVHPTIPSQETSGRFFVHLKELDEVRKLTIEEVYRIMGFPSSYRRNKSKSEAYKQIGNSVPIPLVETLATAIKAQFF